MNSWWNNLLTWFHKDWWVYLLERPKGVSRWTAFWCRASGHPAGPRFYNPYGLEPDWHCRNCNDNLG